MSRASASGNSLSKADIPVVLGMVSRGDRNQDIAAWFGINQGRIAETKRDYSATVAPAVSAHLPPKGPLGIKGKRLRLSLGKIVESAENDAVSVEKLLNDLKNAMANFDVHES